MNWTVFALKIRSTSKFAMTVLSKCMGVGVCVCERADWEREREREKERERERGKAMAGRETDGSAKQKTRTPQTL